MDAKIENTKSEILKKVGFCSFFSDYQAIDKFVMPVSFAPNEDITSNNQPKLFYMYEGEALLLHTRELKEKIYFKAPWFIGEFSLFRGESTFSKVIALTECKCIVIQLTDESKAILLNDNLFLRNMCKHLASSMVNDIRVAVLPDRQKIARYILENSRNTEVFELNKDKIKVRLGISREYVISTIGRLVNDKIIEMVGSSPNKPSTYKVVCKSKLESIANGR